MMKIGDVLNVIAKRCWTMMRIRVLQQLKFFTSSHRIAFATKWGCVDVVIAEDCR